METVAPIDILRRANVEVTVAALSGELAVTGRNGMVMLADTDLDSALASVFFSKKTDTYIIKLKNKTEIYELQRTDIYEASPTSTQILN